MLVARVEEGFAAVGDEIEAEALPERAGEAMALAAAVNRYISEAGAMGRCSSPIVPARGRSSIRRSGASTT